MASYTPFLNLEKPTTSERLDVLKINSNWDKIDAGVSALNSQISTFIKVENGSATIASIAAGGIASTDIEISFPTGYTKANVPLPAYTSSGLPICSCYFGTSSDPTKVKVSVAVRNVTSAAVTNESVTVRVVFSKM